MNILLSYDPQNSLPESSARLISELLRRNGHHLEVINMNERMLSVLSSYDVVILGGVIWFGKVSEKLSRFIETHQSELVNQPLYLYFHSYANDDLFQQQVASSVPLPVLQHAYTTNLGLKVNYSLLNPWEKIRWKLTGQQAEVDDSIEAAKSLVDVILEAAQPAR